MKNDLEQKLIERFGEINISEALKKQILPYVKNDTLVIASTYLAIVVTERSEEGRGIGYWDQVRVFFQDQMAMQEWNWRHKNYQHLDQKHLSVRNIGGIKALKNPNTIIVKVELINNEGSRTVDFKFSTDSAILPLKTGKIPLTIVRPTKEYTRQKIDAKLTYACDTDSIQAMARANGIELTAADFRRVIENNLNMGLVEYLGKAVKIAKKFGLTLGKDDYKRFIFRNLARYEANSKDVKKASTAAKFQKEDFQEIVDYCLKNRISCRICYIDDDYGLKIAQEIIEFGDLDRENYYKVAKLYISRKYYSNAVKLSKTHNIKFTSEEYQQLVAGFLSEVNDGLKNAKHSLRQAQAAAKAGRVKISEDDYRKFLNDYIKMMFKYEKMPASHNDYPQDKLRRIREIADLAGIALE
jgi:hypothetical protein